MTQNIACVQHAVISTGQPNDLIGCQASSIANHDARKCTYNNFYNTSRTRLSDLQNQSMLTCRLNTGCSTINTSFTSVPFQQFQVLFNSLFKVLFIFPSQYLFAIGLPPVFSFRWNLPPI